MGDSSPGPLREAWCLSMSTLQPSQRRDHILSDISQETDDNLIATLSQKYGVSEMTIRRDLKLLEEQGLVRRTYGGAIRLPAATEPLIMAREKRQKLAAEQKAAIARYAVQHFVTEDDIILIGGGTTAAALIPHLAQK